jgi:uncharacterized MAPEG superfamily protein
MSATATAILGLAAWTVALLFMIAGFRMWASFARKKALNTFAPDGSDVPGFGQRLARAHANCYESIPLFIGVMLLALVTGNAQITDPTAMLLVYARVGQSAVHLVSTQVPAVLLRFAFFVFQVALIVCWIVQLAAL